jgi:hypothetical protein
MSGGAQGHLAKQGKAGEGAGEGPSEAIMWR